MAHDALDKLADEMERMTQLQLSFEDLPDDVIMQVMENLDLRSRLRMRLMNKRMYRLEIEVKNKLKSIEFKVFYRANHVIVTPLCDSPLWRSFKYSRPRQRRRFNEMEEVAVGFDRLVHNTHVKKIVLSVSADVPEADQAIRALFNFDADELVIDPVDNGGCEYSMHEVNLSNLLVISQKVKVVRIGVPMREGLNATSLTINCLCSMRKTMIEGNCKLEELRVKVLRYDSRRFLEQCFGVKLTKFNDHHGGIVDNFINTSFHITHGTTKLYTYKKNRMEVHHFEGNLHTTVGGPCIVFRKHNIVTPDHSVLNTTEVTRMTRDSTIDAVDGMEISKLSFEHLPDDVIIQVMKNLDLRTRLKMRLMNKRMNRLELVVKNKLESVVFKMYFCSTRWFITVAATPLDGPPFERTYYCRSMQRGTMEEMEELAIGLNRLSLNSHVKEMELHVSRDFFEADQAITALFNFEADELVIVPGRGLDCEYSTYDLNLSDLLTIAEKFRDVRIVVPIVEGLNGTSLTIQELCLIRKMMIEGDCRLENLTMKMRFEESRHFLEECFGVMLTEIHDPLWFTTSFHIAKGTSELYSYKGDTKEVHHFEGRIHTIIYGGYINFKRYNDIVKPDENYEKTTMYKYTLLDEFH